MDYQVVEKEKFKLVRLSGDVDLETSGTLRTLLLEQLNAGGGLFVDLSGVTLIDSSGIASLVEAYQSGRSRGRPFGLVAVSAPALRVLKLARLDRVFPLFVDESAAAASLPGASLPGG